MNKIYKLKYDRRRNQIVAVSELTAGAGKESTGQVAALAGLTDMCSFRKLLGTLTPLAFLTGLVMSLLPGIALANPDLPTGGQIVAGQGSISTNGNQMTISQNTHGLVTNWNTFDVGQNHTVQFVQPDSSAVALNRVTGGHESQILGTLTANGQVMLVNPAGVMFGKGATVNTAGLVASTKNISNADFMAGHYTFSGGSDAGAEVVNQGNLTTTKGGFIVLAADRVKNSGTIITPGGKTVLAAGDKVTLQLDNTGLASVSVSGSVVNALVENSGLLSATDGRVYLTARGKDMLLNTVVNNTGTVEASGLSGHGGEIVLNGGDSGVVNQSGQLLADSHAGPGGKITVEGQNIHLAANSRTSATGKTGGGEVYVGGGWQGKDSRIGNASKVVMDRSATVDVSATDAGSGGTAVLWSDDYTNFRGTILAKGGALAGDGGRVETSSHKNLQAFGDVDTSASAGHGGNWLLDPLDVTIVSGDTNTSVTESGKGSGATLDTDTDHIFSPSASGARVSAQKIADQLNAGTDVTVDTHADGQEQGSITFAKDASIKKTTAGDATLTLKADKDITFIRRTDYVNPKDKTNGAIVSTHGKLNLNLLAGNDGLNGVITFEPFVRLNLNGGDAVIGQANASAGSAGVSFANFANDDTINAGNIILNTRGGVTGSYSSLNADGDLTVNGPLSVKAGYKLTSGFTAGNKLSITADSGDISFSASATRGDSAGGKILIEGKNGINIQANNGHLVMNVVDKSQNTINVSSDNGSVVLGGKIQDGTDGLSLTNVGITSKDKTTIDGTTSRGKAAVMSGVDITSGGKVDINGSSQNGSGVVLSNGHLKSLSDSIFINGVARSVYDQNNQQAGVLLKGDVVFDALKGTIINAVNTLDTTGYSPPVGLALNSATVSFAGGGNINASSPYAAIMAAFESKILNSGGKLTINATVDGTAKTGPTGAGQSATSGAFVMDNFYNEVFMKFDAGENSNINIIADTTNDKEHRLPGMSAVTPDSTGYQQNGRNGFIFTGAGDISITGKSWLSDGVNTRSFDNHDMTGILTINGESNSGTGVVFDKKLNVRVNNAHINGTSKNGAGVRVISNSGKADLEGNIITGMSDISDGVSITGNNITVTNGSLHGISRGGGVGVMLTGGNNYTIDGASVIGDSMDGVGVGVSGNLAVNDNASIEGTATGEGAAGVKVSGNLNSTGGSDIHGTALSGDGVRVSGDTSLSGVSLSGDTATGTGVNIVGNLKTDEKTTVTGKSTDTGIGVSLGASLEGGKVSGTSADGTGLQLADNATVINSELNGTSTSGDGVSVTGKTILDDTTAQKLHAESGSGNGLSLKDGADISIVHITQSEQPKNDADGKPVTDTSGNPVMETVTTTAPVTAPVTLTGTSGSGSGVATSGNVSISGVMLTGAAATEGSTGVTLGGNLTVADAISGVNAGATGNGTALKISDGVVDAKGYRDTGKTLVIRATSEEGAAVSTSGNSSLISVELGGTASGNGSAVVVSGSLSTDNALTAESKGDKGTALQLSGGHLQSTTANETPVKVTVSATGNGTAVAVTQPESGPSGSGLSGIDLVTSADKGTVLDIGGDLTTNRDISVSTENGTAVSLNGGSLQGAEGEHPVTVTAQATGSGTAVTVKPSSEGKENSLANLTLNTTSAQGDALNVEGVLNTKDVMVVANSTGTGTALNVSGGEIHSQDGTGITATSDSGHAAVINNGKLTGDSAGALTVTATTKTDNPALDIGGTSDISNSVVSGKNSGNGSAVSVAGVVTSSGGGEIKGQTVNGTAVEIKDGTSATSSQEGGLLITATASGEKGTGVVLSNATLTGSRINADATQGNAVTIADGRITGGSIAGHALGGTGLNISNAVLSKVVVSGTTQTGTGAAINGTLTSDNVSQITGSATQDGGNGVNVSGSVTGGQVEGHATSGDAVTVADGSSVADAEVKGDAESGTGVNVAGKAMLTNASLSGTTQTGKGAIIAGSVTADAKSVVSGTATQDGGNGVNVSGSVTGGQVEGHAISGDAVNITGAVSHSEILGDATTGTGVVVNSGSKVEDTAVSGSATAGTGTHWHAGVEHNNVTMTGNSTSGAGVKLDADGSLKNATVNGSTESGKGVDIAGALTSTGGTTIAGHSSGSGTGVDVGGDIIGGSITGNATGTGTGVKVSGQNVNVSDAVVKGSTDSGTGMSVTGNLTGNDFATVTGQATGNGTGVDVSGKLNGTVSGSSSSGIGIRAGDGADIAQGSHVDGHSDSGTGAVIQGSVTNQGSITGQSGSGVGALIGGTVSGKGDITGISKGAGEGVTLEGNVTGGSITGQTDGGTGLSISDNSTLSDVDVSGNTVTGTGVHVKGNLASNSTTTVAGTASGTGTGTLLSGDVTGGVVNGHSADGVGVATDRDVTLTDVAVSGTSVSHSGVQINSHVSNAGSASITGSSESGAGVSLNGTVSGGVLKGHSLGGPGLHVTVDSHVNGVDVSSSSEQGPAVQMDGTLSTSDSSLNGQHLPDTAVVDVVRQAAYQQQGVISHTERQEHPVDKSVSVEVCTDGQCRKLDVGTLLRPVRQ
ncbi:hypothetical protein DOE63_16410 [Salmonella enterica subsp. diarizonae serovar 59:z10:-]|nr:hypothetical protein DOE63_16410 [Salmonella enterica subsp. diarizonae serovar 59:z10:-]